jgi:hypothetical protein
LLSVGTASSFRASDGATPEEDVVIELEAMIEPEAVPPAPRRGRRRQAVVAGVTLLTLVAGGVVLAGGGRSEPKLALMAGNGAGGAETMAGRSAAPAAVPAIGTAADSQAAMYPYGGWGLKFEVDGPLPDLPDHAAAWKVNGPSLDRVAIGRIAGALGLTGDAAQRDGGWFLETADSSFNAFDNGGTWAINFYRGAMSGRIADPGVSAAPTGPAISRADAEQRVRDLLDNMGAPTANWHFETTDTQVGVGWACAAPATGSASGTAGSTPSAGPAEVAPAMPVGKPAPDGSVASCPPPPPPVQGFSVALSPVLDGRRADWPVWTVTLRSDGRVENVYGSWASFGRGSDYKLRGVSDALENLRAVPDVMPLAAGTATAPAVDMPYPMPTVPPAPQVVKITGVELGLVPTSVFEDGKVRMALVPAYRFSGHVETGSPWQTSVIALHPDAIAPPPDTAVTGNVGSGGGGGVTGVGKAVPPTPAATPEPAVLRD